MKELAYALAGALAVGAGSVALGRLFLRPLRLAREEENLLAFVVGAAGLAALTAGLAAAHLARKGAFVGLVLAALAAAFVAADPLVRAGPPGPALTAQAASRPLPRWVGGCSSRP